MYRNVLGKECIKNVRKCSKMYSNVSKCTKMCKNVSKARFARNVVK